MSLVTNGAASVRSQATTSRLNVDPDVSSGPATEWCKGIRIVEIATAASKDVWQPEPKASAFPSHTHETLRIVLHARWPIGIPFGDFCSGPSLEE